MKLSIKNLKGEVFQVDAEPTDSITILKTKIQQTKGLPAESLKIVYKGKTIANQDTIQKLGIKETDFLVVMSQVAKPQPKVETKVELPKPKAQEEKKEVKAQEKKDVPVVPPQPASNQNQASINQLMSMGFPRQECVAALRAAFNNVQRAVQYLLNGIPANIRPPTQPVAGHGSGNSQGQTGQGQPLGVEHLRALFNHPQFAQIRQLIRTNPMALQPILAQISQSSPQLYNLITQHPQQFQRIISEDDGAEGGESEEGQGGQQAPPGTILISSADQQAITRLRQLGFSKIESAQAYFACDKNQDMAANLLFDRLANGDIEMQPQAPPSNQGGNGGNGGNGGQGGQGGSGNNNDDDQDNLFN